MSASEERHDHGPKGDHHHPAPLTDVEVRTRATRAFGGPEETVSPAKQRRVLAAARDFLARWRGPERGARFDVVAIIDSPSGPKLEHFENAFDSGMF